MGLEEIVAKINGDAAEQSSKIASEAKEEASRTIAEAKEKAEGLTSLARAKAEREVRDERMRSVASAHLAAKRELLQAREDVLRRYETGILDAVDEFVKSDDYLGFLKKAVEDGVAKIGKDAVVQVNSRDKALLKGKKMDGRLSPEPIESRGGALVTSADGRRRVDNTIESTLRDRGDLIRLKLVEQVFGDGSKNS